MNQSWTRYLPTLIRRKLEGRHDLQKAIGNSGWLFADNILRMGVGFFVAIWVSRYLGPERYGLLSYAHAFVMLFASVGLLGLEGITVRNLVADPGRSREILGSAFALRLVGVLIAFALTVGFVLLLRPADPQARLLVTIVAAGALFQVFTTLDFWFQSQVLSRYGACARIGASLAVSGIKVGLVLNQAPLTAFAWAGAAEMALAGCGLVAAFRLCGRRPGPWKVTRSMARELLQDCWPLFISDVVMLIYLRVDRIMIGEIAGNAELGIYAVAAMLAEAFYFIPLAIYPSVFPALVEARGNSEELFDARMQRYYGLMALVAYVVAIPMTFIAGWLVPLLFGAAYAGAAPMLIGLVWGGLFYNLMVARSQYLTALNWTRLHFVTDGLGALLNVGLNLALIPRWGGMGAVAASIVAYWFVAHGSCYLFKPLRKTGGMITRAMLCPRIW